MAISGGSRTRISAPSPGNALTWCRRCALPSAADEHPRERLYGRARGRTLRPRQRLLLAQTLPRLRLTQTDIAGYVQRSHPLWLEIGFGGGEHTLAQIQANPGVGLIACEVFENGLCSLLSRLAPEGEEATVKLPAHLRLWDADARVLLRDLPDAILDRVFLLFPDPWPKARHAKRRFVQPANIALLARVMRHGAEWRIASDDPTYQHWVDARMAEPGDFVLLSRASARPNGWPPTRYEAKALRAGRSPIYWTFVRV